MSNSVGINDNFLAKARKLSILPTSLDIFDLRQHYIRILHFCLDPAPIRLRQNGLYGLYDNIPFIIHQVDAPKLLVLDLSSRRGCLVS